jgi:hypothetical protein
MGKLLYMVIMYDIPVHFNHQAVSSRGDRTGVKRISRRCRDAEALSPTPSTGCIGSDLALPHGVLRLDA